MRQVRAGDMTDIDGVLEELRDAGLFRELRVIESAQGPKVRLDGREVLLLCSNDYLGLAGDPRLRDAAADAAERWGAGAGASRLVSREHGAARASSRRSSQRSRAPRRACCSARASWPTRA